MSVLKRAHKYVYLNLGSDSRGDTIIEVLIAAAVISLILVSAYAMTNRNTLAMQDIQEQGQAIKLAERQLELLRQNSTAITGSNVCFDPTGLPSASCNFDGGGAAWGATSIGAKYSVAITNTAGKQYKVAVTWPGLSGPTRNVTMVYQVP